MIARVSTSASQEALRTQTMSLQRALAIANEEMATGRRADVGVAIGTRLSHSETARMQVAALDSLDAMDAAAQTRVEVISSSVAKLREGATKLRDALIGSTQQTEARDGVIAQARGFLEDFVNMMGADVAGVALFGGDRFDGPKIAAYDLTHASGPAAAVAAGFQSAFGMTQDDAGVAAISSSDLKSFLDGGFAQRFAPAGWAADWSSAGDAPFRSQIAPGVTTETTLSANDDAFRAMAQAATMIADLGADTLNDAAFSTLAESAATLLSGSLEGAARLETRMGASQNRLQDGRDAMKATRDALETQISGLESVDPIVAATTVSDLQTRLESSFAVTARLKQLSLLNFL